jgi:hypothetical protein
MRASLFLVGDENGGNVRLVMDQTGGNTRLDDASWKRPLEVDFVRYGLATGLQD